jgi:hypothetical protein
MNTKLKLTVVMLGLFVAVLVVLALGSQPTSQPVLALSTPRPLLDQVGGYAIAAAERVPSVPDAFLKSKPVQALDTTIMSEDFEGTFPTSSWVVSDTYSADGLEYYWGKDDYRPHTGTYSAWCARSGANGLDPESNDYPNYTRSWMIYGPFDLSDADAAELAFYYWNQCEAGYDYLFWGASLDGSQFYGQMTDGDSNGWQQVTFDLTNVYSLGDVTGHSQVWVGFYFYSDSSITDAGAFLDDIVLTKNIVGSGPIVTSITPNNGQQGTVVHITNLAGSNFQSGATVKLIKTGETDINATNVVVVSASQITCDFDLSGASTGQWDVVVTNLDMQSGTLSNGFTVEVQEEEDWYAYLPLVLREYPPSEKYAVVVGIADFLYANDLDYTDDDARDFRQTLLDYGGFEDDNITMLIDSEATKSAIYSAITDWLDSREDANSLVVIFYSAHGTQSSGHEYLVAHDSRYLSECIRDDEFGGWLDNLESQQVVVMVDTCHSGGMIAETLPEGCQARCGSFRPLGAEETAVLPGDGFAKDVDKDGRIVMTACAKDELSVEIGYPIYHGLFTYYLLEGLTSSSADTGSNGWVSAEEVFPYLYPRVVNVNSDQHPQMSDLISGEVDLTQP